MTKHLPKHMMPFVAQKPRQFIYCPVWYSSRYAKILFNYTKDVSRTTAISKMGTRNPSSIHVFIVATLLCILMINNEKF